MTGKSQLRQQARERRRALAAAMPDFALRLAAHADALPVKPGMIVGGYHAMAGEADPALLLARLVETGCAVAFPRVTNKGQALEFHHVPDGEVLAPGSFGIPEPLESWPRAVPDVLLVPLLARVAALEEELTALSGITEQVEGRLDGAIGEIRAALARS